MHCKAVFNGMTGTYAGSTIRQAYIALGSMFKAAKENGLIENIRWMVFVLIVR